LNEALRLYTGDFLQDLSIEGCAAFEEWAFFGLQTPVPEWPASAYGEGG